VLLVVGVLTSGLVGLLLLNTVLAQGSFRLHDLSHRSGDLSDRQQALQLRVDAAGTPHHLARKAKELGLVAAHDPGFLRLSDGRVLGDPQPATLPPPPAPPAPTTDGTKPGAQDTKPDTTTDAKPDTKPGTTTGTKPGTQPGGTARTTHREHAGHHGGNG
jgi:hypothetical protein